jgi:aryl-alcohol dehydrogenase-like predicted oxidoreductase
VDICLDAGAAFLDTANNYSNGLAEEILGEALAGRRDRVLLATKATSPIGPGPNEGGSSRLHLLRCVDDSLRRLRTDWLDVLYMHEFDGTTRVEEVLRTLDDLVGAGKVRYVAASNFSGWALMKSLAASDRHGWARYAAHQVSYSLAERAAA